MKSIQPTPKGKTLYVKMKDKNPSIKSTKQMRAWVDITQRKNKSKPLTKKIGKRPYANKTHGYEMTINNDKTVIYHKLGSDGGALVMMCGKDEEPQPSATTHWKIVMACACCRAMNTHY
jgi:hypothetical protein